MPELPEVEAARSAIADHCIGKKIIKAMIANDAKVIDGVSPSEFEASLLNKTIIAAHRKGKNMWIELDSPPFPSFQFGMTGAVYIKGVAVTKYKRSAVKDADEWPSKFSKFFIELNDGLELSFTDKRRFAKVRLLDNPASVPPVSDLGPDALLEPRTEAELFNSLTKKKIAIKTLLLDQSFISGIGNWVADEVLYQARIHPMQTASSFSRVDSARLLNSIKEVIEKAVEVGADSSQFPCNWIFHSREKKPGKAFVDGKKIDFITIGGRTTAYVPELQKLSGEQAKKAPAKPRKQSSKKNKGDDVSSGEDNGNDDDDAEESDYEGEERRNVKSWQGKDKRGARKPPKRKSYSVEDEDDDDETTGTRSNRTPVKRKTRGKDANESKKSRSEVKMNNTNQSRKLTGKGKKAAADKSSNETNDSDVSEGGNNDNGDQGTSRLAEGEKTQMALGQSNGGSSSRSTEDRTPMLANDDEAQSLSSSDEEILPYGLPIDASPSTSSGPMELHPDKLWFHHNTVARGITSCIQSHYDAPYTCWRMAPQQAKEQWWRNFQSQFQWHPDLDHLVRNEFLGKAARRLKDTVYKACKNGSWHRWMKPEVHDQLVKIRDTPEFKKKSDQFTKNKLTGPKAGTKHSQGSVSTRELADRIYKETGECLSASEMFLRTHVRADQSFVVDRSKNIWETYQRLKADPKVQTENCTDDEIFLRALGGWTKKGTLYGLGSSANVYYKKPIQSNLSSQSTASSEHDQSVVSQLKEELRATKEELRQQKQLYEEQRQQYEEQKDAIEKLREEMARLSQLLQGYSGHSPSRRHDRRKHPSAPPPAV